MFGITDRLSKTAAATALSVLTVHWALILAFLLPRLGRLDYLRLHRTALFGVDWIGPWWEVFVFPVAGCVVFFVNAMLSGILVKRTRRIGAVIHVTTAALEVLLAAAGTMALLLNG